MIAHNVQEAAARRRELAGKMTIVTKAINGTNRSAAAVHRSLAGVLGAGQHAGKRRRNIFLKRVTAA